MEKLIQTIAKMGPDMNSVVPNSALTLITELDSHSSVYDRARFFAMLLGPQQLLADQSSRSEILKHLSEPDAYSLCERLHLDPQDNPWEQLISIRYRLNSAGFKDILNFFGLEYTPPIQYEWGPSDEVIKANDYPLYEHQIAAINTVKRYLVSENKRVLLHMPTGSGKTRTAINVIVDFLRSNDDISNTLVIWLAHNEELCTQAYEEFQRAWSALGNREISVHKRFGQYADKLDTVKSGILFAGLSMLNSRAVNEQTAFLQLARNTRLVVFDEAHMALAPTYSFLVHQLLSPGHAALLGLSATPGRSTYDETKNEDFAKFFCNQKVTLQVKGYANPIEYLQAQGYLAKVSYTSIPYENTAIALTKEDIKVISDGGEIPDRVLAMLGIDAKRNIKILSIILDQVRLSRKIVVFACSVDNARTLGTFLLYKGVKAGVVTGETSKELRQQIVEQFKNDELQVLLNFGVFTTGFDVPQTSVAIIARPTTSLVLYSQMVGRATRGPKVGGNNEAFIFTVTDASLEAFCNMANAFTHWDDAW